MKILITAGATCEAIDDVRFLSNVSTGRTGVILAKIFAEQGHRVSLLYSQTSNTEALSALPGSVETCRFFSTEDLQHKLHAHLSTGCYDAVIQCAAVSDYRPEITHKGKLGSDAKELLLRLIPTPKLLPLLKKYSPNPLLVIGFKLTSRASPGEAREAVKKLLSSGNVDLVIHNDLAERDQKGDARVFNVYSSPDDSLALCGLNELAMQLNKKLLQATLAQSV